VLWGQIALAIGSLLLPRYLVYGKTVGNGVAYRIVAGTLLLPWSMARAVARYVGEVPGFTLGARLDPKFVVALATPLIGCVVVAGLAAVLRVAPRRWSRLAVGTVTVAACVVLTLQLSDAVRAESEFFALVSLADVPHTSPRVVAGAERFLLEHPHSRWRSEALRIGAMAAEASGDDVAAQRRWSEFGDAFEDASVPGVAYAEYSRARCWERLGASRRAAMHYRKAVSVIRGRTDGIQSWIGSQGAAALARRERALGRPMRAAFWSDTANDISAAGRD